MTDDLQQARVEAAAKALEKLPLSLVTRAEAVDAARAALTAADAVVTVEMIADALRSIPDAEPGDRRDPATVIAEYLHSSLFGEVAGDE